MVHRATKTVGCSLPVLLCLLWVSVPRWLLLPLPPALLALRCRLWLESLFTCAQNTRVCLSKSKMPALGECGWTLPRDATIHSTMSARPTSLPPGFRLPIVLTYLSTLVGYRLSMKALLVPNSLRKSGTVDSFQSVLFRLVTEPVTSEEIIRGMAIAEKLKPIIPIRCLPFVTVKVRWLNLYNFTCTWRISSFREILLLFLYSVKMSYLKRLKSGCTSNTGPHPKGGPGHPTSPAPTPMCSPGAIICQSGLSTLLIDGKCCEPNTIRSLFQWSL